MNQATNSKFVSALPDDSENVQTVPDSYDNTLNIYEGVAECTMNDSDNLKTVKIKAKNLAQDNVQKKIADYIYFFLKDRCLLLPEDETLSIANEISNIIGVKYSFIDSDDDNLTVRAIVTAQFDDNDIINYLDKFFREKSALVEQNEALRQKLTKLEKQQDKDSQQISSLDAQNEEFKQKLAESESQHDKYLREVSSKLETQIEELKSQNEALRKENEDLKRQLANSQQNNNRIAPKHIDKSKIDLARQKSDEAWRRFCLIDYNGAIKLYDEAIKLNPNVARFYQYRGSCYHQLGDMKKAQADFAKAKEFGWTG